MLSFNEMQSQTRLLTTKNYKVLSARVAALVSTKTSSFSEIKSSSVSSIKGAETSRSGAMPKVVFVLSLFWIASGAVLWKCRKSTSYFPVSKFFSTTGVNLKQKSAFSSRLGEFRVVNKPNSSGPNLKL